MSTEDADTPFEVVDPADEGETTEEPVVGSADYDEDDGTGGGEGGGDLAAEIEELQRIINSAEATTESLVAAQKNAVSEALASTGAAGAGSDDDARSVFVSEVDFKVTADELAEYFKSSGEIAKVTMLKDKFTSRPKGYAALLARIAVVLFLELA